MDCIRQIQLTVDKSSGNSCPYNSHRSTLRGSQHTGIDSSQNNDGCKQRWNGVQKNLHHLGGCALHTLFRPLFLMGKPQHLHHQYQHNHNTNHHPLLEHISNRGTGQRTVNHHDNRWRDDGPKPTGHYQKSCGPRPWIALFDHIPVEHGSDGNDRCRGRSR